jgi:hypothetical protein
MAYAEDTAAVPCYVGAQRHVATDWLAVYRQNGLKPQASDCRRDPHAGVRNREADNGARPAEGFVVGAPAISCRAALCGTLAEARAGTSIVYAEALDILQHARSVA